MPKPACDCGSPLPLGKPGSAERFAHNTDPLHVLASPPQERGLALRFAEAPPQPTPEEVQCDLCDTRDAIASAAEIVGDLIADGCDDAPVLGLQKAVRAALRRVVAIVGDRIRASCVVCGQPIPMSVQALARSRGRAALYCSPRHRNTAAARKKRAKSNQG